MMKARWLVGAVCSIVAASVSGKSAAAPALRHQVDQQGDFVLFGNTLAHECATGGTPAVPAPVVGTVGSCGSNTGDSSPDVFWRSEQPAAGQAAANSTITNAQSRSTALLQIPSGATITYARLYWSGYRTGGAGADATAVLERPGGFTSNVTADDTFTVSAGGGSAWYSATEDVTALIVAQGPGAYRVSGVTNVALPGFDSENPATAWSMVVFYQLASEPPRNLALFDGLDVVSAGNPQTATLSGFLVPNAGFDAKLGVVTYEGEAQLTGDALIFNGATLSNAVNPANNFFNGTRSALGVPVSIAGDLPQLTGGPRSMSGIDMDVVDVTAQVAAGQTQATIQATSTQDQYLLAAFVTSISTFKPNFNTSTKTFVDLNGGSIKPGDEIEYTVTITNTGNDASVNTVMTDAIPAGVTYVPGSTQISSGPNTGPKTDATGDDQANFNSATSTLTVRLGTGANATQGGTLAIGQTTVVKFKVTVDANANGTISNQAVINAGGQLGAPPTNTPTDGNGGGPGQPPTDINVDECDDDTDCQAPTPFCDTSQVPTICVECVTSAQCTAPGAPDCLANNTCGCAGGPGTCTDSDNDGMSDGFENQIGTDPNDADSDDDGVLDGAELEPGTDTDGDGLINALDPDSDNDGLFDGTELGLDCSNAATNAAKGWCVPDGDQGATKTNPLDADTDDGGASDGSEDSNLNGVVDAGETNPTAGNGADDSSVVDTDADGLSDSLETFLGSNPNDADSDDDGALDGDEANPSADMDGDGLIDVVDVDSDDDGLFDGTEMGFDCSDSATDATKQSCIPDGDNGATKTSPVDPDTDDGGVEDGSEDFNLNGVVDAGETNPNPGNGADDSGVVDTDGDGLSDGLENTIGTDPNDADSDDDGLPDGDEPNPSSDTDGDGTINPLDEDSDGDGLFDGTEAGRDCGGTGTDTAQNKCIPDGDSGATTTGVLDPDTDDGGVSDGDEDTNKNGVVDSGERDPNDPADDQGLPDGGAGSAGSAGAGTGGSAGAGTGGTSTGGTSSGGASGSSTGGSAGTNTGGTLGADDGFSLEGGGCACSVPGRGERDLGALAAVLAALAWIGRRRKR